MISRSFSFRNLPWDEVVVERLDLAGFRVFVSDHANRLTRAFTRPRIGRCALSANGQPAAMTDPPVTIDCLQPLQVTLHFAAEVAFDRYLAVRDCLNDLVDLLR